MATVESIQTVVQIPLTRLWDAMKDCSSLLPKVMPEVFANVESVEGDGISSGSIRILNFGPAVPSVKFIKERIEALDDEKHTMVTSLVDGGLLGILFSLYKVTVSYTPTADGSGTIIDWSVEYEPLVQELSMEESKQGALRTFQAIEAYLQTNNEAYSRVDTADTRMDPEEQV